MPLFPQLHRVQIFLREGELVEGCPDEQFVAVGPGVDEVGIKLTGVDGGFVGAVIFQNIDLTGSSADEMSRIWKPLDLASVEGGVILAEVVSGHST